MGRPDPPAPSLIRSASIAHAAASIVVERGREAAPPVPERMRDMTARRGERGPPGWEGRGGGRREGRGGGRGEGSGHRAPAWPCEGASVSCVRAA